MLAPQKGDAELLKETLKRLVMPNVYFDIAALWHNQKPEVYPYPTMAEHLKNAKAIVGADRIMFGSDMPCTLTGESYANMVGAVIDSVAFTASEMDDVFYNTANKIYFK